MAKKPHDVGYEIYKDFLAEWLTEITRPCTLAAQCQMITFNPPQTAAASALADRRVSRGFSQKSRLPIYFIFSTILHL